MASDLLSVSSLSSDLSSSSSSDYTAIVPYSSSSSSSSSLSFSPISPREKYDVFISFRGEDTRDNFTSHLYNRLIKAKVQTFIDNDSLVRGEEISESLQKSIERSRIAVVVFSENYANSKWCLREVAQIFECMDKSNVSSSPRQKKMVIPVFYRVDPSHVRKQNKGSYKEAFDEHEETFKHDLTEVNSWRKALEKAANLSGWDSQVYKPESKLLDHIVEDVLRKLNRMSPIDSTNLVGIDSRVKQVETLLAMESEPSKVRIVGIWGMGGSGKSTIAGAAFNHICMKFDFEGFHFLPNVREELKRHKQVVDLRNKLYAKILDEESLDISTPNLEIAFIKDRIHRKRVFIVLDDVDDTVRIQDLLGGKQDFFCPGSRILITSRDRKVLQDVADEIYEVRGLNRSEARQVFSLSAFKNKIPDRGFLELTERVLTFTGMNPLALKVLGSTLCSRSKEEWDKALELDSNPQIKSMLRASYDGLSDELRRIFLDIACFFRGEDRDYVTKILGSCYNSAKILIDSLKDKALITISNQNKIEMHDLVQEMARGIVREESIIEPRRRSRLWDSKDICEAMKAEKRTDSIEGIFLDISDSEAKELKLKSDAFKEMEHLRLLKFYVSNFSQDCNAKVVLADGRLECLPNKLSYIHWHRFPLGSLPLNFTAKNLVELDLPYSKITELWSGKQDLANLKRIDLRHSESLQKLPDLSSATNLESIVLQSCRNLVELPNSVGSLQNLEHLDASHCETLRSIPRSLVSRRLRILDLSYCPNVKKCPDVEGDLEELDLSWTPIKELPPALKKLELLRVLRLIGCTNITKFPEVPQNIVELYLSSTGIQEVPSWIDLLRRLVKLDMGDCKKLTSQKSGTYDLQTLREIHASGAASIKKLIHDGQKSITNLPTSLVNVGSLQLLDTTTSITKSLLSTSSVPGVLKASKIKGMLPEIPSVLGGGKAKGPEPESLDSKTKASQPEIKGSGKKSKGMLSGFPSVFSSSKTNKQQPETPDASKPVEEIQPAISGALVVRDEQQLQLNAPGNPSSKTKGLQLMIPYTLGSLFSLTHLTLRGIDFESLPASIKQLSQLVFIDVSKCKRLRSLTDLPPSLECLDADGCKSLESLSSNNDYKDLNLVNCLKLDDMTRLEIMASAQSRIELVANKPREQRMPIQYLFPGNDIPGLFANQNEGTSVTIQSLPPRWKQFNGIAFCIVFGPEESSLLLKQIVSPTMVSFECKCRVKVKEYSEQDIVVRQWEGSLDDRDMVKTNHLLMWYDPCSESVEEGNYFSKYSDSEASFEFNIETWFGQCVVRKCGVLLL